MGTEGEYRYIRNHEVAEMICDGWIPHWEALVGTHHGFWSTLMQKDDTPEEWRAVIGFEGSYEVSSYGRVRSLDRILTKAVPTRGYPRSSKGCVLLPRKAGAGYFQVNLSMPDGVMRRAYVAHIVAEAFIGPRPEGMFVCHNDGFKENNRVDNIRYDTRAANEKDKITHGTIPMGEDVWIAKLSAEDVRSIRREACYTSDKLLAEKYGTTDRNIQTIINRLSWTHLEAVPGEVGTPEGDAKRAETTRRRRAEWAVYLNKSRAKNPDPNLQRPTFSPAPRLRRVAPQAKDAAALA